MYIYYNIKEIIDNKETMQKQPYSLHAYIRRATLPGR